MTTFRISRTLSKICKPSLPQKMKKLVIFDFKNEFDCPNKIPQAEISKFL
jgi:hypothetical protein